MVSRALVVTDRVDLKVRFARLLRRKKLLARTTFRCSPGTLDEKERREADLEALDLRRELQEVVSTYDLIVSLNCRQLFPPDLVRSRTCVNIHPGYNPHNRGWYPHVFSIINHKTAGATLHIMDEKIDHGPVIARQAVSIDPWDRSDDVYRKVVEAQFQLLEDHVQALYEGTFTSQRPEEEGNVNTKRDFEVLKRVDLEERLTGREWIDRLRALSHPPFWNAWFEDPSGARIFVRLELRKATQGDR
jgi:dTDP-4-amino-4,6-dideoxyglucose formyltransferase